MLFLRELVGFDWTLIVMWIIIMVAAIVIEIETLNLVSIWFAVGALVALICGLTFAETYIQFIIFAGTSVIAIAVTWPFAKKITTRTIIRTNTDRHVGQIGIVTKVIVPFEIGEVKVENSIWRAINKEGESFEVGEHVVIDGIEGIKLLISKVNGNKK